MELWHGVVNQAHGVTDVTGDFRPVMMRDVSVCALEVGFLMALIHLRRLLFVMLALPLTFLGLVLTPTLAQAADVSRYTFRGDVVGGWGYTDDGCTQTYTSLWADKSWISYYQASWSCTGASSYVYGGAVPSTFRTTGMKSTHVVADIPVTDYYSGTSSIVHVDNTWTATGPARTVRYTYSERLPGSYVINARYTGSEAPATVAGSIPLTDGFIGKTSYMSVAVTN